MFLQLLDPRADLHPGDQQRIAMEQFPKLVEKTPMHLWNPQFPIRNRGIRILLGLAASYSLYDLRVADVVNETLSRQINNQIQLDVFNAQDDEEFVTHPDRYFPTPPATGSPTPFVGVWTNGAFVGLWTGAKGIWKLIDILRIPMTADQITSSVKFPVDPRMFD